jgi:hypothetical protein
MSTSLRVPSDIAQRTLPVVGFTTLKVGQTIWRNGYNPPTGVCLLNLSTLGTIHKLAVDEEASLKGRRALIDLGVELVRKAGRHSSFLFGGDEKEM